MISSTAGDTFAAVGGDPCSSRCSIIGVGDVTTFEGDDGEIVTGAAAAPAAVGGNVARMTGAVGGAKTGAGDDTATGVGATDMVLGGSC